MKLTEVKGKNNLIEKTLNKNKIDYGKMKKSKIRIRLKKYNDIINESNILKDNKQDYKKIEINLKKN